VTLRVIFGDQQAGPKFRMGYVRFAERVGIAAVTTLQQAARTIVTRGRADMRAAGNFGSARWQQGLHAEPQIDADHGRMQVQVWHDVPYFRVFQKGAVIKGKPLLWIPLSFAGVPKGLLARNYPGGLFRVDRAGKSPLLLSRRDGKPKYFGRKSVRIPKKFHILEIGREVARGLRAMYRANFNATKR
jgi:hypothetical protein